MTVVKSNTLLIRCLITGAICLFASSILSAQTADADLYLKELPKNLELLEPEPQEYRIVTDYFNGDIYGNFFNRTRVSGQYTRGLPDGMVRWSDAKIADGATRDGELGTRKHLTYMEGFSYIPSPDLTEASSFAGFPPNSFHAKNLVWDMLAIETFAWSYFDSLELNQTFRPASINGRVPLAGQGSFENKDIQLRWTGVSKMAGELCALIEYRTMDNPLTINSEGLAIKGRSHYWGTVWVSLTDKQIEYAELCEDVVMQMKMGDQPESLINTTRFIFVEKVQ